MSTDDVLLIAGVVAAVLGLVGAGLKVGRFVGRVVHFLDDWAGEQERPGVPARPGAMERLAKVETDSAQLRRNGGSHLADAIARIDEQVARLDTDATQMRKAGATYLADAFGRINEQIGRIDARLAEHIAECRSREGSSS